MNIADGTLTDYSFLSRYHYTKSKNYIKDDIEFITEFPCLLGHPVLQKTQRNHELFAFFSLKIDNFRLEFICKRSMRIYATETM